MRSTGEGGIVVGGGRGRRVAGLRALAVVMALGGGAGAGAVLGLWAAVSWWAARADAGAHAAGALLAGVVVGGLLGVFVAGAAVVVGMRVRRRPRPVQAGDDGAGAVPDGDQNRSS
jgi:hypothetical protein